MSNRRNVDKSPWAGKTAVVVGASAGLGRALAEMLAAQGVGRLILVAREPSRLQALERQLAESSPDTAFTLCPADVATPAGATALAEYISPRDSQLGRSTGGPEQPLTSNGDRVDLLVNAVGLSDRGPALKLTTGRLDELMRANVHAPLLVVQSLLPHLAPGGVIVNIGSLSSHFAPRFLGGYSIAKHALRALTQQMRLELKESGLHVMLVCPGPIARDDAPGYSRYAQLPTAGDVPPEALAGGGGAKLHGLNPTKLAEEILSAAARRKLELIRPRKARLLICLMALWPSYGESCLRRMTS